jgi:type III restriction enzyme
VAGLQKDISASLSARPRKANEEYFKDKVLKTPTGDVKVTPLMAKELEFYLIQNAYVDVERRVVEKYHSAKKEGTLAELPAQLRPYAEQVFQLVESVFSDALLPEIENELALRPNPPNANFEKKEFQQLWNRINRKAIYAVDFKTDELIDKCVKALDKELKVTPLQYTVIEGEQKDEATYESMKKKDSFVIRESATESVTTSASSVVRYDLIGKLAEDTQLTRRTIATILQRISLPRFNEFKTNPEDFIQKAATLINEQQPTVIVEHLAYNPIDETHSIDMFTQPKKEDLSKGFRANRAIYDYVFTDSTNERNFVTQLDASTEVTVYAKLPKAFQIPTPVGGYNPDWAIAFEHDKVKHVYFVAETKGSMSSMDLRKIEESKIDCARKFFAKITSGQVKYDVVNGYDKLMELVK